MTAKERHANSLAVGINKTEILMHVCVFMYACMQVFIYIWMFVYMYVNIYACIFKRIKKLGIKALKQWNKGSKFLSATAPDGMQKMAAHKFMLRKARAHFAHINMIEGVKEHALGILLLLLFTSLFFFGIFVNEKVFSARIEGVQVAFFI